MLDSLQGVSLRLTQVCYKQVLIGVPSQGLIVLKLLIFKLSYYLLDCLQGSVCKWNQNYLYFRGNKRDIYKKYNSMVAKI